MTPSMLILAATAACLAQPSTAPAPDARAAQVSAPTAAPTPTAYPVSKKVDQVDDYFGTKVADPYRWLEDDRADDTTSWVESQNQVTHAFLAQLPRRDAIRDRLTEIWNYERIGLPTVEGSKYLYSRNTGLQPQSIVYIADSDTAEGQVILDPNTLKADGTAAIAGLALSKDGTKLAYAIADAGSDWNTWYVRDTTTGKDTEDKLQWVKFSGASWMLDGSGFFYSRYEKPEEAKALTGLNENQKVYFHKLGEPQDRDVLVYARPDQSKWGLGAGVTDDGRYLVMNVSDGTDTKNRFFYRDLQKHPLGKPLSEADKKIESIQNDIANIRRKLADPNANLEGGVRKIMEQLLPGTIGKRAQYTKENNSTYRGFVELIPELEASYNFIDNEGSVFYFMTDLTAPKSRVIAIDVTKPERREWKEIIPQSENTLRSVSRVGPRLVATYLKDAQSYIRVFDLAGTHQYDLQLPGIGSAGGFQTRRESATTYYSYTSFTQPPVQFKLDILTGKQEKLREAKVKFNPDEFISEQVFATSKDGTKVPLFVVRKKDTKLDGTAPTILYGYGGFNITQTPGFSLITVAWTEMGGIWVTACLRGGGEYGDAWHKAGTKLRKQNVFDDFIASAEYLVKNNYTKPEHLAIRGGSNGGLLVGAVMTQRPELFGAAIPEVGVMDMLRFHKFTIGWAWKSDYGSSEDDPAMFKTLYAYSPYHQLLRAKPGVKYPPTLVMTADHDDRVVPGHSFKFAAALQAAGAPDNTIDPSRPLLIRIETSAGHGAGKPTKKTIESNADVLAFLAKYLGADAK